MKYTLDSKGYATFATDAYTQASSRVDYLGNGSVSLANKDTNDFYKSLVLGSDAAVWNVEDTDNVYETTVSENDVGAIKTVFIYDTMLGDMTNDVVVTGIAEGSTSLTFTPGADQTVSIKVNGTEVVKSEPAEGRTTVTKTISALVAGDKVVVTISEDNKDTRTMTYEVASGTTPEPIPPEADDADPDVDGKMYYVITAEGDDVALELNNVADKADELEASAVFGSADGMTFTGKVTAVSLKISITDEEYAKLASGYKVEQTNNALLCYDEPLGDINGNVKTKEYVADVYVTGEAGSYVITWDFMVIDDGADITLKFDFDKDGTYDKTVTIDTTCVTFAD